MTETAEKKEQVFSPEWEEWLAGSLLSGMAMEGIVRRLVAQGMPEERALEEIAKILQSPVFRAAEAFALQARRQEMYPRLLLRLEKDAGMQGQIDREPTLSGRDFYRYYVLRNQPVVIPRMAAHWKATRLWSPTYFKENFGDEEIEMMDGREGDPYCDQNYKAHQKTTTMRAFVERIEATEGESNDFYLVANNRNIERTGFSKLFEDVEIDESFFDRTRRESYHSFWFGPRGTKTPLHHDTTNILFFQIYGQKRIRLISPLHTELLVQLRNFYSQVDCDGTPPALLDQFPSVSIKEVVLEPGDGLFLPAGWWHQVRALSVSINLSFMNFRLPNNFEEYAPGRVLPWSEHLQGG